MTPRVAADPSKVVFHRNGIDGEPFHTVPFTWVTEDVDLLAVVFEGQGRIAVLSVLDDPILSYRPEDFESTIRAIVQAYEDDRQ